MPDQTTIEVGLAFIAAIVSYILQRARWPNAVNVTIAGVTIIGAATATIFLQGGLTGNVYTDFLAIAALTAGLQQKALSPLATWLIVNINGGKPDRDWTASAETRHNLPSV